jgi:hypothetical protein
MASAASVMPAMISAGTWAAVIGSIPCSTGTGKPTGLLSVFAMRFSYDIGPRNPGGMMNYGACLVLHLPKASSKASV